MSIEKDFLKLVRPNQWMSNLFVFIGIIFSGELLTGSILINSLIAFLYLCVASSIGVLLQDVMCKNRRNGATFTLLMILLVVLGTGAFWNLVIWLLILLFPVLQIGYVLFLRKLLIIDFLTIAFGYILQVIVGFSVVDIMEISSHELLCALLGGIFLALGKKRREEETFYSHSLIDQWMSLAMMGLLLAYSFYIFNEFPHPWMVGTVPFLLYGLFRYHYLTTRETGKTSDGPLFLGVFLWVVSVVISLYVL